MIVKRLAPLFWATCKCHHIHWEYITIHIYQVCYKVHRSTNELNMYTICIRLHILPNKNTNTKTCRGFPPGFYPKQLLKYPSNVYNSKCTSSGYGCLLVKYQIIASIISQCKITFRWNQSFCQYSVFGHCHQQYQLPDPCLHAAYVRLFWGAHPCDIQLIYSSHYFCTCCTQMSSASRHAHARKRKHRRVGSPSPLLFF